ncbi:RAB6A [Symbiodinium natans]|uniref:RAB6A protein n=1 Tax=Symbiodinium natans TaxID=878477 RepID=A0A812LTT6_9DINO|nr:RAB6A [Symbiodinium natans]
MSRFRRQIHVSFLLLLQAVVVAAIHDGTGARPEVQGDELMRRDVRALVQEDAIGEQPFGPLGYGSLGSSFGSSPYLSSFSSVLGPPKPPSPPGMPIVSATAGKDTTKDKKDIDFNNIDYIGCIIPQWTDGDWICAEAADVPDMQIYDDAQHRTRKKLREGDSCTVRCPDPRYWQKPQPAALVCKSGRWRDQISRVNVKKIECETSARWFFFLGFLTFGLPLCGCCGGAAVLLRMKLKKKPKEDAAQAEAEQPAAEGKEEPKPAEAAEAAS